LQVLSPLPPLCPGLSLKAPSTHPPPLQTAALRAAAEGQRDAAARLSVGAVEKLRLVAAKSKMDVGVRCQIGDVLKTSAEFVANVATLPWGQI
jgi:hypothetical protein